MKRAIGTALLGMLCAATGAGGQPKVEPELATDTNLLARIAALPLNIWMKLPPPQVIGDLAWVDVQGWKSMRQFGPYGRDYSGKAAWMPDRKRAIFAGGGHNVRPLNDVWEYDLAANTWICLYGADMPAQGQRAEWMRENLVLTNGVLQTKRGGPPRLSHTFDGWNYDVDRRIAFMPESLRGAVFVDAKVVAQGLGLTEAELALQWKPAPFFLTFDPYARKWGYVTDNVPMCARDPSARYIAHLKPWWVNSSGAIGLYDPETRASKKLSLKNGGGGFGSSTAYDPETRSVVVITPPDKEGVARTWLYSVDTDTWKLVQPKAPAGGCSASGYFDYDSRTKTFVLFAARSKPNFWIYDARANEWMPVETAGEYPVAGATVGYYDPERDVLVHYNSRDVYVCRLGKPVAQEK